VAPSPQTVPVDGTVRAEQAGEGPPSLVTGHLSALCYAAGGHRAGSVPGSGGCAVLATGRVQKRCDLQTENFILPFVTRASQLVMP